MGVGRFCEQSAWGNASIGRNLGHAEKNRLLVNTHNALIWRSWHLHGLPVSKCAARLVSQSDRRKILHYGVGR